MPKVAYSEAEKAQVREALLTKGLELGETGNTAYDCGTNLQGGRNLSHILLFFFPTKESLIIEALYLQQPRVLVYAQKLMDAPSF